MKIICTIGIIAFLSLNAHAQQEQPNNNSPKHNPEEMLEKRMHKLTEKLSLNNDQQSTVRVLLIREMRKTEEQRKQFESDRKDRMNAARARKEEIDTEMKKILTDDQFKKLQELRKEERENMRERFKERQERKNKVEETY